MFDLSSPDDSPPNLALQDVHYLKNGNATGHERILSSQEGFNDRHESVV